MRRERERKIDRESKSVPDAGHGNIPTRQTERRLPIELKGDVVFDDVDFGYTDPDKIVLHDVRAVCEAGTEDCLCRFHRSR